VAHNITELDLGYVTGGATWHGRPEYHVVEAIGMTDALRCVDYPVKKLAAYSKDGLPVPGGFYAARTDTDPPTILAPNLSCRYEITDRREILNTFDENLLALFPQLRIAGVGTLSAGRTFWVQFLAGRYNVRGDESDHELRLCYAETYGLTAHEIFCSQVRIVCDNTLRYARGDAIASKMFAKVRHTPRADVKIDAAAEALAELEMGLRREVTALEHLAACPVDSAAKRAFLEEFFPKPDADGGEPSARATNRWEADREAFAVAFERGRESMNAKTARSKYGLLQAFTDWADHDSYSRSRYDRWLDAQSGHRAAKKAEALQWLLASSK